MSRAHSRGARVARLALALAALGAAIAGPVMLAGPAAAQQAAERLVIRGVDATDPGSVAVTFGYSGSRDDVSDVAIRQDGDLVETAPKVAPLDDAEQLGVVLLIDSSKSMESKGLIAQVLAAAKSFVSSKSGSDQVAVVTFDNRVQVLQDFTADEAQLLAAIDRIRLDENTHLYDGIVRAARLFDDTSLQRNVVVFSDGQDVGSTASLDRAQGALAATGTALFAIGVPNDGFSRLESMAAATGGTSALADQPAGVGALFEGVQETLRKQYVATYESPSEQGPASLLVTVGDQQATASFVVGSNQSAAAAGEVEVVGDPSGPGFLRSDFGLVLGVVAVLAAVALAVWSLAGTFLNRGPSLASVLQPYEGGFADGAGRPGGFDLDEDPVDRGLAQTPLVQRAVELTGEIAQRRGLLVKLESMLEQANLPLRPAELIFFNAVAAVLLLVLGVALLPPLLGLLLGLVAALAPYGVLSFLAGRRRRAFEGQLPDTLQLLASTLRAGYSLMQGVEAVSQEVAEPMGRELRRVVTEARLGRPLEESLEGVAERMGSADFGWAVMAIRIQREVGGNLAELLITVGDTMTERERLRRDVRGLTAEGRMSAIVLGIMPIALGGFIYTVNPEYMDPLFDETVGQFLLGGAVVLALFGFWWMRKTIEVEI